MTKPKPLRAYQVKAGCSMRYRLKVLNVLMIQGNSVKWLPSPHLYLRSAKHLVFTNIKHCASFREEFQGNLGKALEKIY